MKTDLIVVDMDGTAVQYPNQPFSSTWDALQGILSEEEKREWIRLRDFYVGNSGLYEKWFNEQVALLKGKRVSDAERVLFPIPYSPGFLDFFGFNNDFKKAILSSGVDLVVRKIAEEANFGDYVCQSLETANGSFTGRGRCWSSLDKIEHLHTLSACLEVPLIRTCYIGDHPSDISCFEAVGFPVAFNPRNGLEVYVRETGIPSISDFRELKQILY
ncbi:HAD-IB family phosphatase [Candidatus Pacearchaeota archaeon]|nr:HAD-IB family phosphatase [Candidatus Pacearchaeota archaeon]